jgi:phage-related protein
MASPPGSRPIQRNWRWFRSPGSGRIVAKEEFQALAIHGQAALAEAIKRFKKGEERPGEVKKLKDADDLYEIRVKVGADPFRALFFYDTDVVCVCVSAFYKNQQETPKSDIRTATARKKTWQEVGRENRSDG